MLFLERKGEGSLERGPVLTTAGGGVGFRSWSELSLPIRKAGILAVFPFMSICNLVSRSRDRSPSDFSSSPSSSSFAAGIGAGSKGGIAISVSGNLS